MDVQAGARADDIGEDNIGTGQVGADGARADNFGIGGAGGQSRIGKDKIGEGDGGAKNVRKDKVGARWPGSVGEGLTRECPVREGTVRENKAADASEGGLRVRPYAFDEEPQQDPANPAMRVDADAPCLAQNPRQ